MTRSPSVAAPGGAGRRPPAPPDPLGRRSCEAHAASPPSWSRCSSAPRPRSATCRPTRCGASRGWLGSSENEVFGVATFYAQFRFTPPGRHHLRVCLGTACHVKGGVQMLETLERRLGVAPGETTPDGEYDLERVACLGCCALAPVVTVDDDHLRPDERAQAAGDPRCPRRDA